MLDDEVQERDPFVFVLESEEAMAGNNRPTLSNGHLSTVVYSECLHMNGLYNGRKGSSHPACVPSPFALAVGNGLGRSFKMDMRRGVFEEKVRIMDGFVLRKRLFIHRGADRPQLVVLRVDVDGESGRRVEVMRKNGKTGFGEETALPESSDIVIDDFNSTQRNGRRICSFSATTKEAEFDSIARGNVSMVWHCPRNIFVETGKPMYFIAAVSYRYSDALNAFNRADEESAFLLSSHESEWKALWASGSIESSSRNNFSLAQTIAAAQYYLLSDIRRISNNQTTIGEQRFIGLSPGGSSYAGKGTNYQGHVFWDMDTWMFPPILALQPEWAREIIYSRVKGLQMAKENAKKNGDKGARYPWESAASGLEVSPWNISGW